MKTKFKKVLVSERLPEGGQNVIVISGDGKSGTCYFLRGLWHGQKNGEPKYWLEEVTDNEEEMSELIHHISETMPSGSSLQEKAQTLLTKLKTKES
ncbi:hypothetical protein [Chryseobacterium sp. JK1]|uniref:hypothetical protein n=1 Tax=Chryseobacterium sp. JK1 TaxID=874294 RepID=UPI003D6918D3